MALDDLNNVLALPANRGLAVDIAERLRAAILAGHFGPGERVREEVIARTMGVSRGPVREALIRLEREGLLVIRRNRGAVVAQLAREDLEEVYTLRLALERLAIARAIRFADPSILDRMQAVIDQIAASAPDLTEQAAAELDVAFHDLIYQAARHRRLYDCWADLRPQIHVLFLSRNVANPDWRDYVVSKHQEILDAIRDRDEARALACTEDHLHGSYQRIVEAHAVRPASETALLGGPNGRG